MLWIKIFCSLLLSVLELEMQYLCVRGKRIYDFLQHSNGWCNIHTLRISIILRLFFAMVLFTQKEGRLENSKKEEAQLLVFGGQLMLCGETQQSCQHCCNARYLLLLVHYWIVRCVRFVVDGNTLVNERQQRQQIIFVAILFKLLAQALHKPRSFGCISPRIESFLISDYKKSCISFWLSWL